jgi:hypothetical protein
MKRTQDYASALSNTQTTLDRTLSPAGLDESSNNCYTSTHQAVIVHQNGHTFIHFELARSKSVQDQTISNGLKTLSHIM